MKLKIGKQLRKNCAFKLALWIRMISLKSVGSCSDSLGLDWASLSKE